jgi:hypothetical protein
MRVTATSKGIPRPRVVISSAHTTRHNLLSRDLERTLQPILARGLFVQRSEQFAANIPHFVTAAFQNDLEKVRKMQTLSPRPLFVSDSVNF